MSNWKKSIGIVLLIAVSACSQKVYFSYEVLAPATPLPSVTPWVAGTEQALASPTPWVDGTLTAQAVAANPTAFLDATQMPVMWPTDFSPVLYGGKFYDKPFFILLGGVSQTEWLAPDVSVARYTGEATYELHSMQQASKYFLWGEAPEFSNTCKTYFVNTEAGLEEAGFVAVVNGWSAIKREVTQLSPEGEFYQQAVLDWLSATEGVTEPEIGTLQVFRVDLEGDGTDEIFISATHLDESQHTTRAGDYSVVLMRKVIGNDTVTKLVVGDVYHSKEAEITYPRTYTLANFIDLDQDGVLEAVVDIRQWEGLGAIVYQVEGQNLVQVLRAEC